MNDLKSVENCSGLEWIYENKRIRFEKDKNNNSYKIKAGKNIYEFDNFKKAINHNVIKSRYGEWLTLLDLEKIFNLYEKISNIELKGQILGQTIFIDEHSDLDNSYDYDDNWDDEKEEYLEIEW